MKPSHLDGFRRPRGQLVVILSVVLVALVGAMALSTDVAVVYFKYTQLQAATDAAALAGANYLPAQTADAVSAATTYALQNGILPSEITGILVAPAGANIITVKTARNVPAFFARVLGLNQFTVSAKAVAASEPVGINVTGILPIGLDETTPYANGQTITMRQGGVGPGNWGGLGLGGSGGSNFQNNLANGFSGTVSIGDSLTSEPGAMFGPTQNGINARLDAGQSFDPGATWNEHHLSDPRAITVPLVDWSRAGGRGQVQCLGFAELWLTGVSGTNISGIFIAQAARGNPSPNAPYAGALHVALIQ